MLSPLFKPVDFADCPGWRDDQHLEAFRAFALSAEQVQIKPYKSGSLGINFEALAPIFADSRETIVESDRPGKGTFSRNGSVPRALKIPKRIPKQSVVL